MLNKIPLQQILFLDIETVPMAEHFNDLPVHYQKLWIKKAAALNRNEEKTAEERFEQAGIYAEFGKIICISVGLFHNQKGSRYFRLKSFFGDDEKQILLDFIDLLKEFNSKELYLCGHNGKEFDFPYLARRILINGLKIPSVLDVAGKKPWEVPFLDTMELWKFGDYKHYTSLELLAAVFDIPTPKDDIDGSMVAEVYYKEKNLERIATYCEKDVVTTARVYLKYLGGPPVEDKYITSVTGFDER